jgi:hypothetical protein
MREVSRKVDETAYGEFLQKRCMGVLTKVDKQLEMNSKNTATQYNSDAAAKLRESLTCEKHPPHMDKWPWVAVVNPNHEEQTQVRLPTVDWNVTCR